VASPISTGGSGVHFESHVGAYFLASVLTGGSVRGLPSGTTSTAVKFQRAFEGSALDDVIVHGTSMAGTATLSLQVKRTFTFGDNELFDEVMAQCWETYKTAASQDRFGVAVATTTGRFEQAGRNVLAWVRQSANFTDFFLRIKTKKLASDGMRTFLKAVRDGLDRSAGVAVGDETVWKFLRHFVVLYFDFEHDEASERRIEVTERLRYALPPKDNGRAPDLWRSLVEIVDATKSSAGSVDRPQLIERLAGNFQLVPMRQWLPAIEKLREVAARAIGDIKTDIGGIHLTRQTLIESLDEQINTEQFIEIVGEPGSGKSALLKDLATRKAEEGPILFLKATRLYGDIAGWEGLASLWQLDVPLDELIAELGCIEVPCLFIDGIERISQPGVWLAVNDILKAIYRSNAASRWRVLVSTRSNSLAYRTHLIPSEIRQIKRLTVSELSDEDIGDICAAHPRLAGLIGEDGRAREIAARPYLLDRLTRIELPHTASDEPLSEIDLMIQIWTSCANSDQDSEQLVMARQDVLIAIGRQRLVQPNRHLTSVGLSSEALSSLIRDDLLRHDLVTRELEFAHDIVEDWILCQTLQHESRTIAEVVNALGQPLWLLDPIQLLAQWHIERGRTLDGWNTLLNSLSTESMQPRWRRAVLTSILQSARAYSLLQKITSALWENDARLLIELMTAIRTLEVEPNPIAFDTILIPNLNDTERLELAHSLAIPRLKSWRHFLPWIVPQLDNLPPALVEETTKVLGTFCDAFHFFPNWSAKPIARFARKWLAYMERTDEMNYDELSKRLKAMSVHYGDAKKIRIALRKLLINAVDDAPEVMAEHLAAVAVGQSQGANFFIEYSNRVVKKLPSELVDFLLKVMLPSLGEEPYDFDGVMSFNELGVKHEHLFFPASHLRPPFLALLRHAPEQGIRLINSLCNHAMQVWRNIFQYERSGTPMPLPLSFDWGTKEFWGHAREYTWFRAIGPGPFPVESALMALEVWMEEQIAADCDPEALFRQVLEGNDCIGTVGACIAIAMANQNKCLKAALPFVTNPRLHAYDIRRVVQDGSNSMANLIGSPKDRPFLEGVAKRNLLPHRRLTLRDLIGSYLFNSNSELRTEFTQQIISISEEDLPFDFAEQRTDEAITQELREAVQRLKAMATPDNWKIGQEIENGFTIEYCPPPELAVSAELLAEQDRQQKAMRLAMWAEKCLEEQRMSDGITLADAIALAHELDADNLFDSPATDNDFHLKNQRGAVAGVASVMARFADELTHETLDWVEETLSRALNTPFDASSFLYERSEVLFDPHVLATDGLAALVERNLTNSDDEEVLLSLVCHPLHKVKKVAFRGFAKSWERKPLLCWQAFALGMKLSVMPWAVLDTRRGNIELHRTEEEIEWLRQQLDAVLEDFKAGRRTSLPAVPPPWDDNLDPDMHPHALKRSSMAFLWHLAPLVLNAQPRQKLLESLEQRKEVLRLTRDLVRWTILDAVPPGNRRRHQHQRAYKWGMSFMEWCAELTLHLTFEETNELILTPLAETAEEREGEHLLEDFIRDFVHQRLEQDKVPDDTAFRIWNRLFEIVLSHPDSRGAQNDDFVSSGYGSCVVSLIFSCYGRSQFEHPWPALQAFTPGIEKWTEAFGASPAYFGYWAEFMLHAGRGLFPSPALGWLHTITLVRKEDNRFWQHHENGDKAATLLFVILDEHGQLLSGNASLLQQIGNIADHLVNHGVRLAAQVQQRLTKLQKQH